MKISSITMVKNEAMIIESFVRYHMPLLQKMYIIDNGCTDGTIDILKQLQKEGIQIEIFNESFLEYEQSYVENKYLSRIANLNQDDFLIPLDADEFIASNCKSVVQILKGLQRGCVYYLNWVNYVVSDRDSETEQFIPRKMKYCLEYKEKSEKKFTKVIVPISLLNEKRITVSTGHHSIEKVIPKDNIIIEYFTELYIAHFPVTSYEQMVTKIVGSYNGFIPWMERQIGTGYHINEMRKILFEGNEDQIKKILQGGYIVGIENLDKCNLVKKPLLCEDIKIKYTKEHKVDVLRYFMNQAEILGLRLCYEKQCKRFKGHAQKKVIIYGTGSVADKVYSRIMSRDDIEIVAWVDSDRLKSYCKKNGIIIIPPERIKFLEYDQIIIASSFYDEIYEILCQSEVELSKVVGQDYVRQ